MFEKELANNVHLSKNEQEPGLWGPSLRWRITCSSVFPQNILCLKSICCAVSLLFAGYMVRSRAPRNELNGLASQSATQPQSVGITPQLTLQSNQVAQGDVAEHDVVQFQNRYIDAFPNWARLNHLVIHYNNGTTVEGEPSYGPDCTNA